MFWIILSGILTGGFIPIVALIGFGIKLIVSIFIPVTWGYWGCFAVGVVFGCIPGVQIYSIRLRKKNESES